MVFNFNVKLSIKWHVHYISAQVIKNAGPQYNCVSAKESRLGSRARLPVSNEMTCGMGATVSVAKLFACGASAEITDHV